MSPIQVSGARLAALLASLVFLACDVLPGRAEDAASEFTPTTNMPGAAWNYAWKPNRTGAFTLFATFGTDGVGQKYWNHAGSQTGVYYNPSLATVTPVAGVSIPGKTMTLRPGTGGQHAVVRWTAAVAGSYAVRARFTSRSLSSFAAKEISVVAGSGVVYSAWMQPSDLGNTASMSAVLAVAAGGTIDFEVGPADEDNNQDWVGLDATVNFVPPSSAGAPFLTFAGQRFMPCRWPGKTFESIAFDPVQRRLASAGDLSDLCGNRISDGPGEAPGLAWDLRTQTYWQITNDRTVRRWSAVGALLDTVFAIPETFTVPGSGLDTIESVRGIAVDSNFVYVVDAGANPGQVTSNAWFKFSRAGAPVKSSRSTNFVANLDADPDALVDDIVYVPFTSPFHKGRLLIALEHSGIQVVDTEGQYVDRFRWTAQGLTPTRAGTRLLGKTAAFAGLTIDPASGNLYLTDNDFGDCQVWTRIVGTSPVVIGVVGGTVSGSPAAVLQLPNPGCNLNLWGTITSGGSSNYFGDAYRAGERTMYTCEFGTGELWRLDALSGQGSRVGHTGVNSVWGMTWDTERNVLYGSMELISGRRIFAIDPVSGAVSPLTQTNAFYITDIAYHEVDHGIYGVELGAPPRLIRIDRDTGVGTVVGPTAPARGLEYDAGSGKLIGNGDGRLWRITPATGVAETLAVLPQNVGWEGLTLIPVPPNPVSVEPPGEIHDEGLRAWPNPSRGSFTVEFALPRAGEARVRVFDVAGRAVRELGSRRFGAGRQRLEWDGRDGAGGAVASGIYFVRVESGNHAMVTRVTRVR